jgi:4'-phosphopantetheinyl transferase
MMAPHPPAPGHVALYAAHPDRLADDEATARLETMCTGAERARIGRYRFDVDRRQHLVTRALLRAALSRHAAVAPEEWRFRENAHGRPEIDPPPFAALRFNATNTKTLVACAVTAGADVGIDAEPRGRAESILEVAPTVFSEPEIEELGALQSDPEAALERALALWTLKESYVKARGVGLGLPLRKITMVLGRDLSVALRTEASVDPDPGRWKFLLTSRDGHVLAVAVDGRSAPDPVFRAFETPFEI